MNFIHYINYKIYNRFLKQDGSHSSALGATLIAVPLLFCLNIVTLLNIFCVSISKDPIIIFEGNIALKSLYIYLGICIINYFFVYLDSKYIKIFDAIRRNQRYGFYYYIVSFLYPLASVFFQAPQF